VVDEYDITVVPLSVLFGDDEYLDGVTITAEQFFTRLDREPTVPTTSQPPPQRVREAYEALAAAGADEILSIHVSGALSGTLDAARQGAAGLDGVRVRHVDSQFASLALGMGVVSAARAAKDGGGLDEVRELVEDQFRRTELYFVVDTLEYLRRGGRIGRGAEMFGSLLKIKPLLAMRQGELVPVARVRTKGRAIEELLRRLSDMRPIQYAGVVHSVSPRELDYVADRLHGLAPDVPILAGSLGPVLGVHGGPGLIGACAVRAPSESDSPAPTIP
jgi:DegV family protein with EDD domain